MLFDPTSVICVRHCRASSTDVERLPAKRRQTR
jgi:hypothetical protein